MELLEKERRRLEKKTGVVLSDKEEKEVSGFFRAQACLAELSLGFDCSSSRGPKLWRIWRNNVLKLME